MADILAELQRAFGDTHTIERELGGGGMSRVFLATDRALDRKVVVKVLPPELAATVNLQRFKREIMLAARLQHPHIVGVLAAGETNGMPWFTMPFVEGEALWQRLSRVGEFPIAETLHVLRDIATALQYAHERGVVHRDIKPDNVLISGGSAAVADFGVAKALVRATESPQDGISSIGIALGTPAYMAPEQAAADPDVDHRADIYSFGILGYEMLTGQAPFAGRPTQAVLAAHAIETPEPVSRRRPSVPPQLNDLIGWCMAKRPADRPQSAAEVLRILEQIPATTGPTAAGASTRPKLNRWIPLNRGMLAGVAVVLVAVIIWMTRDRIRAAAGGASAAPPALAVLPFHNLGAPADEYFADGISEEITGRLSRISGLGVIARGSAIQYKGSLKPLREIARELDVQYLLTGTVRWDKRGNVSRVRVSPELIRVADQQRIWSEPYDASIEDVFSVQSSVAEQVAQALHVRLRPQERSVVGTRPTHDLDAYDCYLRGKAFASRAASVNMESLRQAVEMFQCATEKDPRFAAAHAALARAYWAQWANSDDASRERLQAVFSAARRALELESRLPEAHLALAAYYRGMRDTASAVASVQRAVALDPTNVEALIAIGRDQLARGQFTSAATTFEKASRLDPRHPEPPANLSAVYDLLRQYDKAIRTREREIALSPQNPTAYEANAVSWILWKGDTAAARREFERGIRAIGYTGMLHALVYPVAWTSVPRELLAVWDSASRPTAGLPSVPYYGRKAFYYEFVGDQRRMKAYAESTLVATAQLAGRADQFFVVHTFRAFAYRQLGRYTEALAAANEGIRLQGAPVMVIASSWSLQLRALTFMAMGQPDRAIADLERVVTSPSHVSRASLRVDWQFAPLRNHPGFQRLVATGP